MIISLKNALMLTILLPVCLWAAELSIQIGTNHSWFYFPENNVILDNEFNPNLNLGLSRSGLAAGNFRFGYGLRLLWVGRFDKFQLNHTKQEVKIKHLYISVPVKISYAIIPKLIIFTNVEPALQIHSKYTYKVNVSASDESRTITGEMNKFNLFTGVGLEYLFSFTNHKLGISVMINFGLLRIPKDREYDVTEEGYRSWADWRAREILLNFEYFIF